VNATVKKLTATLTFLFCIHIAFAAEEDQRVRKAGQALNEIFSAGDGIPPDLLSKAACILIFPSVEKGAFGMGGSYGRGVMVCRSGPHHTGPWGSPALYALEGHSIKFPGGRNMDFILLVMTPEAANRLLSSTVKLGSQVSAAAGPLPITPGQASVATVEILSYLRDRGTFTGISLAGSILRSDSNADQKLYGKKKLTAKAIIVDGKVEVPPSAKGLVSLLNSKSPPNPS
jgi:SH3 domain-containing YSC84-like protein 1